MSLFPAVLSKRVLRGGFTSAKSLVRTSLRYFSTGTDAASKKERYNKRPMKTYFKGYDKKFDERLAQLEVEKREALKNWDIVGSAFVERPQIIIEDPDPIETEYQEFQDYLNEKYMVPITDMLDGKEEYEEIHNEAVQLVKEYEEILASDSSRDPDQVRLELSARYAGTDIGARISEEFNLLAKPDSARIRSTG